MPLLNKQRHFHFQRSLAYEFLLLLFRQGKTFRHEKVLQQFPQRLHKKISTPIDATRSSVHNPLTSRKELRGMVGATLKTS